MTTIGRNQPCPCGSGRKYKQCCLAKESAPPSRTASTELPLAILDHAKRRFGRHFAQEAHDTFTGGGELGDNEEQLFWPFVLYHFELEGTTLAASLLANGRPPPHLRSVLEAQLRSWLSVWEVVRAFPGEGLELRDLLTGAERSVRERKGSQGVVPGDHLLCRVVEADDHFELDGLAPQPLGPAAGASVVGEFRRRHRRKVKPFTPEELRTEGACLELIDGWYAVIARRQQPPTLNNTDGDPLVFVTERFSVVDGRERELIALLDRAFDREDEDGPTTWVASVAGNRMHQGWDNTIVANLRLDGGELTVETNSLHRADEQRRELEKLAGAAIRHRARTLTDPLSSRAERPPPRTAEEPPPPEVLAAMREMKERHYRAWVDLPINALGGRTPREAAADRRLRPSLELLVREAEHIEARQPAEARFDFTEVRRELGLP